MKRFEYLQVEYSKYPTSEELNEEGMEGWELINIHQFKKEFFNNELEFYYDKTIYLVTFKKEVL